MAVFALSVRVLVAGQPRWKLGWLDPASLTIMIDDTPAERVSPRQVLAISSWPRATPPGSFPLVRDVPVTAQPEPDPSDAGRVALLGVICGFDREQIARAIWPEWKTAGTKQAQRQMRAVAVTSSALAMATLTNGDGALAVAG